MREYQKPFTMTFDFIDFPKAGYKGLIFDLDGTLVDSMPAHFQAWCQALDEHDAPGIFEEDVFYAMGGRPTKDIVVELNGEMNLNLDPDAVALSKRMAFLELLDQIELVQPIIDFARANKGKVPMAIATGGTRAIATKTLEALGLDDLFDTMITADDVSCGKPDPEVFLKAAEAIQVAPEDCVAFEDAAPGIMAAQTAGMQVVTVPASLKVLV